MSNPVEKYLSRNAPAEKTAGMFDKLPGQLAQGAVKGVAMGATGAGLAGVAFGARKLYDAVTKRRDFRLMMENNPDLHEHLERDPKFFNQAYSSLRSVNPQFSAEPLIAGNYMRQMMESPLTAGGKIELALQGAHGSGSPVLEQFTKNLGEGLKSGLGAPGEDPNMALRQKVEGMRLQKQEADLSAPMFSPVGASPMPRPKPPRPNNF